MPESWCSFLYKLAEVIDPQINKFECEFYKYWINNLSMIFHKYYARYKCNHTFELYYGNHLHYDHVIQTILPIFCKHAVETANKSNMDNSNV